VWTCTRNINKYGNLERDEVYLANLEAYTIAPFPMERRVSMDAVICRELIVSGQTLVTHLVVISFVRRCSSSDTACGIYHACSCESTKRSLANFGKSHSGGSHGLHRRADSPERLVTEVLMQAMWFMVGRMGYDYCVFQHVLHVL